MAITMRTIQQTNMYIDNGIKFAEETWAAMQGWYILCSSSCRHIGSMYILWLRSNRIASAISWKWAFYTYRTEESLPCPNYDWNYVWALACLASGSYVLRFLEHFWIGLDAISHFIFGYFFFNFRTFFSYLH